MPDYNEVLIDPATFFAQGPVTIDPRTILTLPPQYDRQAVQTMTVANGGVIQVYDVTNPASPVLLGTIG